MKDNFNENKIVSSLMGKSVDAKPSPEFKSRLNKDIDKRISRKNNIFNNLQNIMNNKLLLGVITVLVLITTATGTVLFLNKNSTTTIGSELPTEQLKKLEDAKGKLTFAVKVPSKKIKNEKLADIRLGLKQQYSPIDDSDTIYLTYKEGNNTFYTLTETTQVGNWPQGESIKVGNLNGTFYKIPGEENENPNAPNSAGNAELPRSYIFWKDRNVTYSVSEYGGLSKDQLARIGGSLVGFK